MRRPRSPDKHSNVSVSQSNTSTFDRKRAKLPPPGYENPLIGRLVLTPVSELSMQETAKLNNLQQLPANMDINRHNSLILLQQGSINKSPMIQEIPTAFVFQAAQTNTILAETMSNSNTSTASQGSASIRNETDKEEENKREVFV